MLKKFTLFLLFFAQGSLVFAQKPRLFVLTVGVSKYLSTSIGELNFADNDARDLAAAFQKQTEIWNVREVKTLTDEQATRRNIRDELDRFRTQVNSSDFFIFAFSGHGGRGRLLPHDTDVTDPEISTLSKEFLFERLEALGCGYLVFVDACHSGSFAKNSQLPGDKNDGSDKAEMGRIDRDIREMMDILADEDKPYLVFGSSGSSQKSWECESCQNGYFAQTILDALDNRAVTEGNDTYFPDLNNDGKLTPAELDEYIKNAVRVRTFTAGAVQKVYSRMTQGMSLKLFQVAARPSETRRNDSSPPVVVPRTDDALARDLADWKIAKTADTEAAYRKYLADHPNGEFRDAANEALRQMAASGARERDDLAYRVALEKNSEAGFEKYLDDFPGGWHRTEASEKLAGLLQINDMILILGGTFQMGEEGSERREKLKKIMKSEPEKDKSDEKKEVAHTVTISDFYFSKYEVTVEKFQKFVEETGYLTDAEKEGFSWRWDEDWQKLENANWRHDPEGKIAKKSHPVIHVSWNDAVAYCEWLSRKSGKIYRLPTEAEWEYAAGNGAKHTKYSWGNGLPSGKNGGNVADDTKRPSDNEHWREPRFSGFTDGYWYTAPVGSYNPNTFGLYDMTGNVWEMCSDWEGDYSAENQTNPTGATSGSKKVKRGGAWYNPPNYCKITVRDSNSETRRTCVTGFRVARTKD